MPVPAQTRVNRYTGNGVTTVFAYGFKILSKTHLRVTVAGAVKTVDVDYTVSGVGTVSGGNVTLSVAPANAAKVVIKSNAPYSRSIDYVRNGSFKEETVDGDFDALEIQNQQIDERLGRSLSIPVDDSTGTSVELPVAASRANKALIFDADGNVTVSTDDYDDQAANAAASAAAADTAKTAAQAAQAAAEAVFDNFDDRYLGAKAVAPTLDNDGNALQNGALYFDTTLKVLRVYDLATTTWISLPVTSLSALTDVTLTSIAAGEILKWDGTKWINNTLAEAGIEPAQTAASQAEAESGTEPGIRSFSPLRIAQAIAALGASGAQIQPISASVASNALTISAPSLSLDFRSTTLGSGTVTTVSGDPADLVISSGSTLGTVSGSQSDIAVLALNVSGTLELAVCNAGGGVDLSETGLVSTTAEGGAGAADSASVVYSTTARASVPYRILGIIRSTQATAGTWATAPSLIQGAGGQASVKGVSMVRLNTANGYGSTNTKIRRFTNVVANLGSDITYADSAANGASFTINTPGIYAISYNDQFSAGAYWGLTLNTTQPTTSIQSLANVSEILGAANAPVNTPDGTSVTLYLPAGSVIRAHTDGISTGVNTWGCQFTITRVG